MSAVLEHPSARRHSRRPAPLAGVAAYVHQLAAATPLALADAERQGVPGPLLKELAKQLGLPGQRLFAMLGVPRATAEKKSAQGEQLTGAGGQAAVGLLRLLGQAQGLVAESTSPQARGFDTSTWLGRWLQVPQPALGGRCPGDLLDTPSGQAMVSRLLGALQSGAYQ